MRHLGLRTLIYDIWSRLIQPLLLGLRCITRLDREYPLKLLLCFRCFWCKLRILIVRLLSIQSCRRHLTVVYDADLWSVACNATMSLSYISHGHVDSQGCSCFCSISCLSFWFLLFVLLPCALCVLLVCVVSIRCSHILLSACHVFLFCCTVAGLHISISVTCFLAFT